MLSIGNKWIQGAYSKKKTIEYRKSDFYGPFLNLSLEEFEGGIKKVTPISSDIETPECSASQFSLLSEASKELYSKIGKFILCCPKIGIEVEINSTNTEEVLDKEIKERIRFF